MGSLSRQQLTFIPLLVIDQQWPILTGRRIDAIRLHTGYLAVLINYEKLIVA